MRSETEPNDLEEANYEEAIKQRDLKSNRYYKGREIPILVELSHFKIYGVGIYLFFAFLKELSFLFLILSIVSIGPITFNIVSGNTLKSSSKSMDVIFSKTSLGSYQYSLMNGENNYNISMQAKYLNVEFDIISCFILFVFCLYWEKKSRTIEKHIAEEIKLLSNSTVEISNIDEETTESSMRELMLKFGKVVEVVAARDYTQELEICQKIYGKEVELRELRIERKCDFQDKDEKEEEISELLSELETLYEELDNVETRKHSILRYYVQFETKEQCRELIFKTHQSFPFCLCKQVPEEFKDLGKHVEIKQCGTEPTGILWENAHIKGVSRIWRHALQTIIILVFIVGGFILICFLNILVPNSNSNEDTENYSYNDIQNLQNDKFSEAWCIKNMQLWTSSHQYSEVCEQYWKNYTLNIFIEISISWIIMLLCEFIKRTIYFMAHFQRYRTSAEKQVTVMTNIFILDLMTTTLITFLMQANIFNLSVPGLLKLLFKHSAFIDNVTNISEYDDLTSNWYKDIGYQLWFNLFMMMVLPHIYMPFHHKIDECFVKWRASKEKIHRKMVEKMLKNDFEIEDQYSNLLVIVGTGFIFGGGIQLFMPVVAVCLGTRYIYLRYLFICNSKVPQVYNQLLNNRAIKILKGILLCRCLISIYMYGADDVFAFDKDAFRSWAKDLQVPLVRSIFIIISRFLSTWYYSMFLIIFIIGFLLKEPLFKSISFWKRIKRRSIQINSTPNSTNTIVNTTTNATSNDIFGETTENVEEKSFKILQLKPPVCNEDFNRSMSSWCSNDDEIRSQRTQVKSYRIECNPEYQELLAIMKIKKNRQSSKRMESLNVNNSTSEDIRKKEEASVLKENSKKNERIKTQVHSSNILISVNEIEQASDFEEQA